MELPKVSPSKLDRLCSCPRYAPADRKEGDDIDLAMSAGIRFHGLMEDIAKHENPLQRINEIPDFLDRRAAEYSWGQVSGIIAAGASIVGVEMQLPESSVCRRGIADLVLRYGNTLVVVDWKLTRAEGEHDLQMIAYAVMALEADLEIEAVRTLVIAPVIQHVESSIHDRATLPALQTRILQLMAAVENPFTPGHPGDVCIGCRRAGKCPAQCRELVPVSNEALMPVAFGELLNPSTPEGRARRRYFADWLASAVEGIKADDLKWVKEGNEPPPGYKLISKAGRSSIPAESVPQAIDTLVSLGYSLDSIHAACTLFTSKLAAGIAPASGEDEKELKKKIDASLSKFMINGAPSEYLQRTSKKAMAELFKATMPNLLD